jgi:phosphatidylglycerol:prolipoprotein diacylglycerol transferase
MMQPPVDPILFEIGPLALHWYGLLIVTGIMLGATVARYLAKRDGKDPDIIWDMMMVVVLLGIVGARAYHVFSQPAGGLLGWDYYKTHPLEAFAIWQGGLGIYGAIAGGALGVVIFSAFRKLNVPRWLDFLSPAVAIGQSIGRWGNYINQELYGPPTDLPWGLAIDAEHRIPPFTDLAEYPASVRFHPTFLYESLATLALCILLIWAADRWREERQPGDLFLGYLFGYAVIRFFIEYLRPDAWTMGALATAQWIAIGLGIVSVLALVGRRIVGNPRGQETG